MSDVRRIAQVSLSSARTCLVKKNYGRAFANFLLFLKLAPQRKEEVRSEFSVAMREWSESLEREGKIDDLFKCYDQACEMFPNHDAVLNNIGAQLFRLGYTEEAAAYIRRALIINPDYLAARENLENICSHLVERWHFRMLNDVKRNKGYKDAIRRAVSKGYDNVLDIGTGTGILSLIACDVGASIVYACEKSHAMYEVARDVLQANFAYDKVLLFHQSSTDLAVPDDLSERVNLVVTETFDAGLFGEHIISTLTHAWKNLLCNIPSMMGSVIPCAATMYVCGIESEALRKQNRLQYPMLQNVDLSDVDIICTTGQVAEEPYTTENLSQLTGGYKMLTNVTELLRVNFCNPHELEVLQLGKDWIASLLVKQHGHLDALAVWFDLHLDECVTITTAPDIENCWEQAVYPVLSVQRQRDTGQEICYLNKEEILQATFHFEHDCLRLSTCEVHIDKNKTSDKVQSEISTKEHNSIKYVDSQEQKTCNISNKCGSSNLPLRKRKIRNEFISGEIDHTKDEITNNEIVNTETPNNDHTKDSEMDSNLGQTDGSQQNRVVIATDEYLLQQCGNLTINNGIRSGAVSQPNYDTESKNMSAMSETQHSTIAYLDEFNLNSGDSNRGDQLPLLSQSRFNTSQVPPDGKEHKIVNASTESDNTPKQLVEYLDDSDEDSEDSQSLTDNRNQNSELNIDSFMLDDKINFAGQNNDEQLFSESYSINEAEAITEDVAVNLDVGSGDRKLNIFVPLDSLEMISQEQYCETVTSMQNCEIETTEVANTGCEPVRFKSNNTCTFSEKRNVYKQVCLAEHSDILYLNDIHLNRSYFKVLENLQRKQDSFSSLSFMYNTSRLCFLALQARSLTFDPVTMVTSEEHHGTLQTVMAANNLKPDDLRLLDFSEADNDDEKYDVILVDLVEPCGALRQQVLEDIALLRVTALSDRGVFIPEKVTIQGIFIESLELENASHVTGNHKTLGYSIADFINVFQLRNHVNIDLETLPHTKLTEVFQLFYLDLNQPNDSDTLQGLRQTNKIRLKALDSGTITALVYWFELELSADIKVCTLGPRSHWKQAGIMMKEETNVELDQYLVAMVTLQNSCLDVTVEYPAEHKINT